MDRNAEITEKRRRVREFLEREGLDGVLLSSQALFAWYTGGGENRVALGSDAGAATLLCTRERDFVLANNIEAPRLEAEALAGCNGIELVTFPWTDEARALPEEAARLVRDADSSPTPVGRAGRCRPPSRS